MSSKVALFFPIVLLMFTAVLYQSIAISDVSAGYFDGSATYTNSSNIGGSLNENGTVTTSDMGGVSLTVGFDWTTGAIAVMVAGVGICALVGIRVLGSGLSEFSVKVIGKVTLFYCLWMLVSLFGLEAFELMPFELGWVCYLFLTMFYTFGVLGEL